MIGELASYFDKYYSIASSLSQMGLAFGIMIIPLLTQLFIDVYGWRGTMLILGALNTQLILSGAVMRPIYKFKEDQRTSSVKTPPHFSSKHTVSFFHEITYYLDMNLFYNAKFLSMVLYQMSNGYCFTGWVIYLVPYAMDVGFTPYKATALATFGGIGNLLGCAIYPLAIRRLSATTTLYNYFHFSHFYCTCSKPSFLRFFYYELYWIRYSDCCFWVWTRCFSISRLSKG